MSIEKILERLMRDPLALPAFALGTCILLGALLVAMAIHVHANMLRQLAQQAARDRTARMALCDANWRWAVQRIAADVLGESVEVIAFSGMVQGRISEMRFVLRDGRALVFATHRRVASCCGWGKSLRMQRHATVIGQLHAVWEYFAQTAGQAVPLPSRATWFVMPLQAQQQRHLLRPPARSAPLRQVLRAGGGHE
jgi:hypothetical protein